MLHGARSYLLQDEDGQTIESHSISAGLDYPGVGPEHAYLAKTGPGPLRADHRRGGDGRRSALLCRTEGIIPAIESAHAIAGAVKLAGGARPGRAVVWSTCPAGATRTWTRPDGGSGFSTTDATSRRRALDDGGTGSGVEQ